MVPKNWLFFLPRSPTHHNFSFDLRFFYELKHKVRLSKTVCGILHFQFRFVFIKVYICVQQDAWKLWLLDVIIPFKINPIQDGHFRGYSRMEGGKFAPLTKICQISYSDETWHCYTLPKEDPKNISITMHTTEFCWHKHFFAGNHQILSYQEIQI